MRLVLQLDPSALEFTEPNAGGAYPYLLTVGSLRMAARAGTPTGITATESSSLSVTLDNRQRKVAAIVGRPLRAAASVYDGDDLFFEGTISSVEYGDVLTLEIDA